MRKRFKWSIILSVISISIIIYPNLILLTDPPLSAREQGKLNFMVISIVESLLVFGITFNIVSEYFRQHPDYKSLVNGFKNSHPDIPDKYLHGVDKGKDGNHEG